jgi:hypothetical protein
MKWAGSLFLVACILTGSILPVEAASVEGVVRYRDNTPAARVRVEIGDNRAVTDNNGNFVMWVDPGVYGVQVNGRTCEPSRFAVTPRGKNWIEIFCDRR